MKRMHLGAAALISVLSLPTLAGEIDGKAVLGSAIGSAAGAAVGSAVGGRGGAIIGGAIGGAAGAAVSTSGKKRLEAVRPEQQVIVVPGYGGHHDYGLHRGHYKHKRKHRHGHDDD